MSEVRAGRRHRLHVPHHGAAWEEEMLFYRDYRASPVDPLALAYYRCDRTLYDLTNDICNSRRQQAIESLVRGVIQE